MPLWSLEFVNYQNLEHCAIAVLTWLKVEVSQLKSAIIER